MVRIWRNIDGLEYFEEFLLIKGVEFFVLFKKIQVFLERLIKLSEREGYFLFAGQEQDQTYQNIINGDRIEENLCVLVL